MSEINDILLRIAGRGGDQGPSLARRLGVGPQAPSDPGRPSGRASDLDLLAASGARIARGERLAASEARLLRAAETLIETGPASAVRTETVGRRARVDRRSESETVTVEQEVTTPAGPALQFSFAFAAPDDNAVGSSGQIRFGLDGPNVRIDVPSGGATLDELATLINTDSQNGGRLLATVVESEGSYRLRVETTQTGSSQRIRINRDDFGLFDPALEQRNGTDESTETVETEEERVTITRVVDLEDIERQVLVGDDAYATLTGELVGAFNALRAELGSRRLATGPLLDGARSSTLDALDSALFDLSSSVASRVTDSGTTLADLGLGATANGDLDLDAIAFQRALTERPAEAVELLTSSANGFARDVVAVIGSVSRPSSETPASELVLRGRLEQIARLLPGRR